MKIIAKVSSTAVLVEMNRSEISRIHGQNYDSDYSKFNDAWMSVGSEMNLDALCSTLDALRSLDAAKVDNVKKYMETALAQVNQCKTNLEALLLFDKLAET